jgi:hypothetical protein
MVLCIIYTFPNGSRFRNQTHTRRILAKGTDADNARRQIENVHDYYRERYPLDDMTIRDCSKMEKSITHSKRKASKKRKRKRKSSY